MKSVPQRTSDLHRLETEMQQLVGPFISVPGRLPADNREKNGNRWFILDHLEYVFHVNLELMVYLHALPDADRNPPRNPTLTARFVLLTGILPSSIDKKMAMEYIPGEIDRERDFNWLQEHFKFWNDKLAGLHFLPEGWEDKVVNNEHPALGYLNGSDWIRLMYLFTRYHRKKVEKL